MDWILVAIWLLAAVLAALADSWLFEADFLLSLAVCPVLLLTGLVIVLGLLFSVQWKPALALVCGALLVVFSPLPMIGHYGWSWMSFAQHRTSYEAIVAEAGALPPRGRRHGAIYSIEPGPPVRVAFPRSHGIPDGWSGVVHDPSRTINDLAGTAAVVFDDNVMSCIHITGPWFRCWFD